MDLPFEEVLAGAEKVLRTLSAVECEALAEVCAGKIKASNSRPDRSGAVAVSYFYLTKNRTAPVRKLISIGFVEVTPSSEVKVTEIIRKCIDASSNQKAGG